MVRALVVASATLSILVVCFALYRVSQSQDGLIARSDEPRLPPTRTEPFPAHSEESIESSGVEMGAGIVGPAQDIRLTVYPREGTRARLEIEVRDWMPKPGSSNEFVLDRPTLRTRTSDGHAIRVRAKEGVVEAMRHRGGSLDPQRGWLSGDVVIEYDRLTSEERASRSGSEGQEIDSAEIVRIDAPEVEFDFEYSKLLVPGKLTLRAEEVDLTGEGLEVRFNDAAGRMESLRINRGGRIELRDTSELLGLSVPGVSAGTEERMTVGAWLRAMLQRASSAGAAPRVAQPGPEAPAEKSEEAGMVTANDEGVPVFHLGKDEPEAPRETVQYRARFTGGVDVRQWGPKALAAHVTADELEILRSVGAEQASPAASAGGGSPNSTTQPQGAMQQATDASQGRIIVAWNGPLIVTTTGGSATAGADPPASRVTFRGAPTIIRSRDGAARCGELTFVEGSAEVHMAAEAGRPFLLGSQERGVITGIELSASRGADRESWDVVVRGPGSVMRPADKSGGGPYEPSGARELADVARLAEPVADEEPDVAFRERMRATIREIRKTTVALSGFVTRRTFRVLDDAAFEGGATIRDGNAVLRAASIHLAFQAQHGWGTVKSVLERLEAETNVVVAEDDDRLTCSRLEVDMRTDPSGERWPEKAVARRDVSAVQGARRVTASDRIEVAFERRAGGLSGAAANDSSGKVVARKIRGWGDVTVVDPAENLDLGADHLDCTLGSTRNIESLSLASEADSSSIQVDDLTISGKHIRLNAEAETADVPGAGSLTFLSYKDLSGETLRAPIPITITWTDSLAYRGRDNKALFAGNVHARSKTRSATFDCDRMMVEFVDVAKDAAAKEPRPLDWTPVIDVWEQIAVRAGLKEASDAKRRQVDRLRFLGTGDGPGRRVSKEPAYLLATGNAVAVMADHDSSTGELSRRARLSGPKLSVSLRDEVSKLLIEGPGTLQLEDFRIPAPGRRAGALESGGTLFDPEASGPSKTLIEWRHAMWYDFGIEQTRFEGDVELKHFSGAALARLFASSAAREGSTPDAEAALRPGRSTFLHSDTLTVDFSDRAGRRQSAERRRLAALGTASLRRFEAAGSVTLQDEVEGLALWSERLVYEQPRQILAIFGTSRRQARLVLQDRGRPPRDLRADRMIYDLKTGEAELFNPLATGR